MVLLALLDDHIFTPLITVRDPSVLLLWKTLSTQTFGRKKHMWKTASLRPVTQRKAWLCKVAWKGRTRMPTLNFCPRLKVDVSRNTFFVSELLKNSQTYTELLRGGSEATGLWDTWAFEPVNKPLCLPGFSARWSQLNSSSWFHCSGGNAVGDVGCDLCQQHRGTCQIHSIVHFTGLQANVCFLSG